MAIRALTAEQLREGNRRWAEMRGFRVDESPDIEYQNVDAVASMYEDAPYVFDGVLYDVAPLSVPDGGKVVRLAARLEKLRGRTIDEVGDELERVFHEGIKLFKQLMKPRGVPRWVWRYMMKNPFRRMSEREFATALAFLALCRMRSRDAHSSGRVTRLPS